MATRSRIAARISARAPHRRRPARARGPPRPRRSRPTVRPTAVVRFFAHGWIGEYFLEPRTFFTYFGFEWVRPWPASACTSTSRRWAPSRCASPSGCSTARASRARRAVRVRAPDRQDQLPEPLLPRRLACASSMAFLPLHRCASLDAGGARSSAAPPSRRGWNGAARADRRAVYVFGGIAKLKPDWLLGAQPMQISAGAEHRRPADRPAVRRAVGGLRHVLGRRAYDLSIVPLLLWRRSRPLAFAVATFHLSDACGCSSSACSRDHDGELARVPAARLARARGAATKLRRGLRRPARLAPGPTTETPRRPPAPCPPAARGAALALLGAYFALHSPCRSATCSTPATCCGPRRATLRCVDADGEDRLGGRARPRRHRPASAGSSRPPTYLTQVPGQDDVVAARHDPASSRTSSPTTSAPAASATPRSGSTPSRRSTGGGGRGSSIRPSISRTRPSGLLPQALDLAAPERRGSALGSTQRAVK